MTRRRLSGGTVLTPLGPASSDVVVEGGVVAGLVDRDEPSDDDERIDVSGALVAPGFIDLQLNGGYGIDVTSEPHRIGELARMLPRHGVTAFLPTVVTSPPSARRAAAEAVVALRRDDNGAVALRRDGNGAAARPLGLHVEGPMLAPSRRGAHSAELLGDVDAAELASWRPDAGVTLVTLAPERPGALAVIDQLRAQGVVVAVGHTEAGPDEFAAARRAGVTYVTHLFNAMRPFTHRDPGTVGAVLIDDGVVAGLVCDGLHVDPVAVRLAWRLLGPQRLNLVTDAVAALGAPVGTIRLGRMEVTVDETGVRTAEGVLAGSNLSLDAAVRNLVAFTGCDPFDALRTVTSTPAGVLGRSDLGDIRTGERADLVVLGDDLGVTMTLVGGAVAWRS
jgi:N-acetylglucosamine-6-phosphate deacetylase